MDNVLWYIISALGLVVAGALGLIVYLLARKRVPEQAEANEEAPVDDDQEVFGLLETANGERHLLDADAYLIGRHSSNDLSIADPSVSRQHAEIHRRADGIFRIVDLDSMNGVFINDKQLKQSVLRDGDKVELGDACLHFRVLSESEMAGDETMAIDMSSVAAERSSSGNPD